jgi:hypothetical protein
LGHRDGLYLDVSLNAVGEFAQFSVNEGGDRGVLVVNAGSVNKVLEGSPNGPFKHATVIEPDLGRITGLGRLDCRAGW